MANQMHLNVFKQGVAAWNRWRAENPEIRPDLDGADLDQADFRDADLCDANVSAASLREACLRRADLRRAHLRRTDLSGATLYDANLRGADLCQANLHGADLRETNFRDANLSETDLGQAKLGWGNLFRADLGEANLTGANLCWANLTGVDLGGGNLSGAVIGYTNFVDMDLSAVKGLKSVRHDGPSTIGLDTLYRSRGQIPGAFLRGAGVPDAFIAYIASLTGEAIRYHSCFISYSTRDQSFAEQLYADLQGKGVRCWFAPEDIAGGRKLYDQIDQAIYVHDKLLLVLSAHSLGSEWVMTEIRRARRVEAREGRRKLFPIRLVNMEALRAWECFDADAGKDLAVEVREYFIPDFSAWKDGDAYQHAFERLLRDLKAD